MTTLNPKKLALAILGPAALVAGIAAGARVAILRKKAAEIAIKEAAVKEDPLSSDTDASDEADAESTCAKENEIPDEAAASSVAAPEEAFEAEDLTATE